METDRFCARESGEYRVTQIEQLRLSSRELLRTDKPVRFVKNVENR